MRYFYTDPLAAAWMGKHFGMRFEGLESWQSSDLVDGYGSESIHPDSLALLEPMEGDVGITADNEMAVHYRSIYNKWCTNTSTYKGRDTVKIIQRNGIPFMWPEKGRV